MSNSLLFPTLAVVSLVLFAPFALAEQAPAAKAVVPIVKESAFRTPVLKRAQIDKLLEHPDDLLIIDVRGPDELVSIGGFPVYLSVQPADLERSLAWIPKDRQVLTVSNHANRAGRFGDVLTAKGFKVAGAVGVQLYEQEGGKLTRIPPHKKKS